MPESRLQSDWICVLARSQIIDWRSWRAADHEEETLSPEEHTSADGAVQLMGRATFPEAYLLGVEVLNSFESVTIPPDTDSAQLLRIAEASLEELKFPPLVRPNIPFDSAPTKDLVDWTIQLYSFSFLSQFRALLRGVIPLIESRNIPTLRIIVRALFELGAHSYYVKKHVKQHLEAKNLEATWKFLIPVGTSSLYTISPYPQESQMFPSSAHIGEVINCFNEIMEGDAANIYSLLSEFCHPDMAVLRQHFQWDGSQLVTFDAPEGKTALPLGASATLAALDAVGELLELSNETEIRTKVIQLLRKLVSSRRMK